MTSSPVVTVITCPPHASGTANCAFCHIIVDLTAAHYSVRCAHSNIGFCICNACTSAAVVASLSGEWPEIVKRGFGL